MYSEDPSDRNIRKEKKQKCVPKNIQMNWEITGIAWISVNFKVLCLGSLTSSYIYLSISKCTVIASKGRKMSVPQRNSDSSYTRIGVDPARWNQEYLHTKGFFQNTIQSNCELKAPNTTDHTN